MNVAPLYTGRLAPSPTGLLHLGHVRTFAVARRHAWAVGGSLRLRIDDLDPRRSRGEYVEAAVEDLRWLGLTWEGELWFQSRRSAAYRAAWEQLVIDGWVYPCRCSRRELQSMASAPHEGPGNVANLEPAADESLYPGTCRPVWAAGAAAGAADRGAWLSAGPRGRNWRFRVQDGATVCFTDGGFGPQRFVSGRDFGDFAVWRRDDVPAYQLATVVDDAAMGVTEVVRGADLLRSTARQILLFRALGFREPDWYHCPLVVDAQGQRLAKRANSLAVRTLRESGFAAAEVLRRAEALPVGSAHVRDMDIG